MEDELWRDIPGYEGFYQASTFGNIRRIVSAQQRRKRAPHVLKQKTTRDGYRGVQLYVNGTCEDLKVHTLVLSTFGGPRPAEQQCNHIDGNRSNNRAENLEWMTALANMSHAYGTLGRVRPRGSVNKNAKLSEEDIPAVRALLAQRVYQRAIARRFGISQSTVSCIRRGLLWAHIQDLPTREDVVATGMA